MEHSDTVLYEIYMLRFAAEQLDLNKTDKDAWVYLESFLLHFRNLIEFLGMPNRRFETDLGVETMCRHLPTATLKQIREKGIELFKDYERVEGSISQYLAHCTEVRVVNKQWPVDEMYGRLESLLKEVEDCLKPSEGFSQRMKRISPIGFRAPLKGSISIGTHTANTALASTTHTEGRLVHFDMPGISTEWPELLRGPENPPDKE